MKEQGKKQGELLHMLQKQQHQFLHVMQNFKTYLYSLAIGSKLPTTPTTYVNDENNMVEMAVDSTIQDAAQPDASENHTDICTIKISKRYIEPNQAVTKDHARCLLPALQQQSSTAVEHKYLELCECKNTLRKWAHEKVSDKRTVGIAVWDWM